MKVRLKVYIQGTGFPGDVVTVELDHGERLVAAGLAEEVEGAA